MDEKVGVNWFLGVFFKDCFMPIVIALVFWLCGERFWETTVFLCLCEIFCNFYIERMEWPIHRVLVRKITGPLLAPYIALSLFSFLAKDWSGDGGDGLVAVEMMNIADAWGQYFAFLFYKIAWSFGEPILDVCVFGTTGQTVRGTFQDKYHSFRAGLKDK